MSGKRWTLRLGGPGYPEHLARSPWPPQVLFGMGDPAALRPSLGIVGSRAATPYGLSAARMFASPAAAAGVVVVSGAAAGCDQAAQRAALSSGGMSVAVLGCGADVDYPWSAHDLLAELRAGAGAVVSEQPWGMPALRHQFVPRNRIIAALSAVLLVVEAGLPSGTFSTADFALDAGRDVIAVPGSIHARTSAGANRLIRQGAHAITDVSELMAALAEAELLPEGTSFEDGERVDARSDALLRAVLADPMRPDDLARRLGQDIVAVVRRLTRLEAEGLIARYPDGNYGPSAASRGRRGR